MPKSMDNKDLKTQKYYIFPIGWLIDQSLYSAYYVMHNLYDYFRLCARRLSREKKNNISIARLSSLGPCGHASYLDMEVVLKVKTNIIIYVTFAIHKRGFNTKYGDNRRLSSTHLLPYICILLLAYELTTSSVIIILYYYVPCIQSRQCVYNILAYNIYANLR